ncbi:mercuric transport protein periplasmic component [Aliikangiella marina]|uniref:Mercuric transport protein periplasmic component n=1 Tax=Aliikangiella marina TaxID=1712262 RepID=A0A545TJC8_9GAMM|nr:cation transporter [Aliikangiella marina]TQV77339.1 mercuric transport protein periplasmic component [Aliikangiella marina]
MKLLSKYFFVLTFTLTSFSTMAAIKEVTLKVDHMDCATCPVVVRAALYDLEGVDKVKVSMKDKTVKVTFDDEKLKSSDLATAVTNAGFPAKLTDS